MFQLEVEKHKVTLRVTNSMVKLLFFRFRVTNSRLKNKKFHFELPTWWECTFIFSHSSCEREVDKWKNYLITAISKWHGLPHSIKFFVFSLLCCKYICEFIWVCWILMAYQSSTTYLLTRLKYAGLYNYNGRQIEIWNSLWID